MSELYERLRARRRQSGESVRRYILEMQEIASLGDIKDRELIAHIVRGLNDNSVDVAVLNCSQTITELKRNVEMYDQLKKDRSQRSFTDRLSGLRTWYDPKGIIEARERWTAPGGNTRAQPLNGTRVANNVQRASANANNQRRPANNPIVCYNCSERGHLSPQCPNEQKRPRNQCFSCHEIGHHAAQCPKKKIAHIVENENIELPERFNWNDDIEAAEAAEELAGKEVPIMQQVRVEFFAGGSSSITVSNKKILIDSGSPCNFIRRSAVPSNIKCSVTPYSSTFSGIGNEKRLKIFGQVLCTIFIGNKSNEINCFILPDEVLPMDILAGRDFMSKFGIKLRMDLHPISYIRKFHELFKFLVEKISNKNEKIGLSPNKQILFDLTNVPENLRICEKGNVSKSALDSINRIASACSPSFIDVCHKVVDALSVHAQPIIQTEKQIKRKEKINNEQTRAESSGDTMSDLLPDCKNKCAMLHQTIECI